MLFKLYKPKTPSQRQLVRLKLFELKKKPLLKNKIIGKKTSSGRNNTGKITVRHKGGGLKTRYRFINFNRTSISESIVCSIEYDPNRSANIAALYDKKKKEFFYILAPIDLKMGDIVKSGPKANIKVGHSLPISKIPIGCYIHNISNKENHFGQFSRSAGSFSILVERNLKNAKVKLTSGKVIRVPTNSYATVGVVSNPAHFLITLGKAGQSRWLNKRPSVRGVAMNPIDHPNGGGEGKKSSKRKTPWGKI